MTTTATTRAWTAKAGGVFTCAFIVGCTGATFGEQVAGEDTYLEPDFFDDSDGDGVFLGIGSIGVDPDNEHSLVVQSVRATVDVDGDGDGDGTDETKRLFSVPPDGDGDFATRDVTGLRDLRMLFPGGRGLFLAEEDGVDVLSLVDTVTLETVDVIPTQARYHGTRLSPSRTQLAVCDNNASPCPIHVVDLATKEIAVLPHGAAWLEAMWLWQSDTLVAALFYPDDPDTDGVDESYARLTAYPWDAVVASGYAVDGDVYAERTFDITFDGARADFWFSFTWIGVAPDDRTVALPLRMDGAHVLALVDTAGGGVRMIDDARGPVGFTPDGSTVVSYRYTEQPCDAACEDAGGVASAIPELLLIDVVDLVTTTIPLPTIDAPEYFVTRTGNLVVVADSWSERGLVLADLDAGTTRTLEGPTVNFGELVSHGNELFITDFGLFRVDLVAGLVTEVDLEFAPRKINLLPQLDRLVVDDGTGSGIVFLDPASGAETGRTTFTPSPATPALP